MAWACPILLKELQTYILWKHHNFFPAFLSQYIICYLWYWSLFNTIANLPFAIRLFTVKLSFHSVFACWLQLVKLSQTKLNSSLERKIYIKKCKEAFTISGWHLSYFLMWLLNKDPYWETWEQQDWSPIENCKGGKAFSPRITWIGLSGIVYLPMRWYCSFSFIGQRKCNPTVKCRKAERRTTWAPFSTWKRSKNGRVIFSFHFGSVKPRSLCLDKKPLRHQEEIKATVIR